MRRTFALLLAALFLTGCTPAESQQNGLRVENCGSVETFARPPQRVVSLNQHATEVLLALGLGDRLVGTAFPDDHVPPPEVAAEYAEVPLLSDRYPSYERILEAEPDLVVGGYASAFDEAEGRGREAFAKSGINTLLLSESCASAPSGMDTLLADITMFGEALGLQDNARKLNADIEGRVRAVEQRLQGVQPVDVFVYDSGEQAAFTLGGNGVGNDALTRAGGRNVFSDVPKVFEDVSWEQVAARAPEAIVLVDYLGAPVQHKQSYLEGHPLASGAPAVRNHRFSTIPLVELTEGIRFPAAVERLARDLHGA
ncbi:ABC transporter substrate-binding protein [Saccharopolyspora hirsuta]|uniref:ABC transporter substrate-binding protein n=1 Tax=Saccharopolyspora hirsuta TaxID=1837 RepID=A0A5M7B8N1_SACHI|nr:ABC transporter substrate-binding protein [Saccharopolyspora hirsuta]KAA5824597.1 ABC transporter substrate-binding protein [Saccharopolyspora hirsuta]